MVSDAAAFEKATETLKSLKSEISYSPLNFSGPRFGTICPKFSNGGKRPRPGSTVIRLAKQQSSQFANVKQSFTSGAAYNVKQSFTSGSASRPLHRRAALCVQGELSETAQSGGARRARSGLPRYPAIQISKFGGRHLHQHRLCINPRPPDLFRLLHNGYPILLVLQISDISGHRPGFKPRQASQPSAANTRPALGRTHNRR